MAQQAMYQQMVFPTRFVWAYGGKQVHLCGSFTNWLETVPMAPEPTPNGVQVFAVVCNLPPGYHQYKFIVDGEWRHDENQAFIQDPLGNVNNWLFVKKPGTSGEGAGGQAIPIPQPPQGGSGGGGDSGMDWIGSSMGQMQIKRDSEGQLKQPQQGSISAMGVKGVAGAVPGAEGAPDASRARVLEFLQRHTAYELIPESNKVVVLDTELPVRRAFHACFEQGIMAAPLWDERRREFVGMLSAGDFIDITQIVGSSLANTSVSEAELDAHTIAAVRAEQAAETGRAPAPLVSVRPEDSLHLVSLTLMQGRLALAPVLSYGAHVPRGQTPSASAAEMGEAGSGTGGETPQTGGSRADANDAASPSHRRDGGSSSGGASGGGGMPGARPLGAPQLLHLTNLAEVLACLVRHFRGVPSALPLFSQPVGALPLGTWTAALGGFRGSQRQPGGGGNPSAGVEGAPRSAAAAAASAGTPAPQLLPIKAILPSSTVADAFRMMPGCGALPVVDEAGRLVDVYARADVILLAANNTYRRVALNEFTVAQALAAGRNPQREAAAAQQAAMHAAAAAAQGAQAAGTPPPHARNPGLPSPRAHTCTRADTLRAVVEALSLPGVRRLVVVDAATGVVEGVVSLSDVVAFLLSS